VEDKVQQEVLYRALAMGLEKDDTIVKRRMVQKLQFLAEDVATAHEPDTAELKAWYEKNRDKFALPGRITFRQRYYSPDSRGDHARADAERALAKLAGQPVDSPVAASLEDVRQLHETRGTPEAPENPVRFTVLTGHTLPTAVQPPRPPPAELFCWS
jgi:peptidyl-prolyl cis-trans isomerase C